jgi:hypothetical protein
VGKFLLFKINDLIFCLKNRQINETAPKQGKISEVKTFSAELSTETVDFFPLASRSISLQRKQRIARATGR